MSELRELFLRRVAQTSASPIGLEIESAEGSWLRATDGRRYLDLIAGMGVAALGHGHPAVLAAIERQARAYLHVMVYGEYVLDPQVRLAARLAELLPTPLDRVYFTNSGAEAIEGALKTARKLTRRDAFIAFEGAYHGDTTGAMALAGNPAFRTPFGALIGPVRHLPYDDAGALAAIDKSVAAVIAEPVQSEGGVRIPSRGFIAELRRRCTEAGVLLVFDEVLTGLGRTGKLFALEHFGVVPDLIVLAKALGGGLPLGAFIGSEAVLAELAHDPPLGHITTFGGHPLSCAAGLAALEVIVGGRLWERAAELGALFCDRLRGLAGAEVLRVRHLGLLIGLEFPTADAAHLFVAESIARGVVVNWTLNADRVVRLAPPLTLERSELEFALEAMGNALIIASRHA